MGLAPDQVDAMSLYQFFAISDGWRKAHNPDGAGADKVQESDMLRWASTVGTA